MKKLIHTHSDDRAQLHCDNPRCGYVMPKGHLTWGPHLIGFPCPRCFSNMLTRRDYEASEKMVRWVARINRWFGWLGTEEPPANASITSIRNTPGGWEMRPGK